MGNIKKNAVHGSVLTVCVCQCIAQTAGWLNATSPLHMIITNMIIKHKDLGEKYFSYKSSSGN